MGNSGFCGQKVKKIEEGRCCTVVFMKIFFSCTLDVVCYLWVTKSGLGWCGSAHLILQFEKLRLIEVLLVCV
jgi:hypothetical protein